MPVRRRCRSPIRRARQGPAQPSGWCAAPAPARAQVLRRTAGRPSARLLTGRRDLRGRRRSRLGLGLPVPARVRARARRGRRPLGLRLAAGSVRRSASTVVSGVRCLADHGELHADLDGLVLLHLDRQQRPGRGRRHLGVDLVGGDLEQRLVGVDVLTLGLEPPGHGALGDALTEAGHGHGRRHGRCELLRLQMVRRAERQNSGQVRQVSRARAGACRRAAGAPRRSPRTASGAGGSAARPRRGRPPSCRSAAPPRSARRRGPRRCGRRAPC